MKTADSTLAHVARWFHALSDDTRVQVVEMLAGGEKCVCELQGAVGAAQSRLSFHLKVLREAGLVHDRKQGRWNYYALRPEVLEEMAGWLQARKPEESALGTCGCGESHPGSCC